MFYHQVGFTVHYSIYPLFWTSQARPKSQETKGILLKNVYFVSEIICNDLKKNYNCFIIFLFWKSSYELSDAHSLLFLWGKKKLRKQNCFSDPVWLHLSRKKQGVELHKWHSLSSLFLHPFNCSPSFQVGEEQCKVDNVSWHADHAEIPQDKGENWREIERAGNRHPGGEDQTDCCFLGQWQTCNKKQKQNFRPSVKDTTWSISGKPCINYHDKLDLMANDQFFVTINLNKHVLNVSLFDQQNMHHWMKYLKGRASHGSHKCWNANNILPKNSQHYSIICTRQWQTYQGTSAESKIWCQARCWAGSGHYLWPQRTGPNQNHVPICQKKTKKKENSQNNPLLARKWNHGLAAFSFLIL